MFSLQVQHVEIFCEFMELHPDFAKGRLSASNARDQFRNLWMNLTNKLNCLGLGERSTEKWQKTWAEYKSNLKKKAAEIKRSQEITGEGPQLLKKLSDLESRILFGTTFFAGVGNEERSLNVTRGVLADLPVTSTTNSLSMKRDSSNDAVVNDHDYLCLGKQKESNSAKRKKIDPMAAYEETINSLYKIENILQYGLTNMNQTLMEGFQLIAETLKRPS